MERKSDDIGCGTVIANCEVAVAGTARKLSFEALIEDDGACISLLTPYVTRENYLTHAYGADLPSEDEWNHEHEMMVPQPFQDPEAVKSE